MPCEIFILTSSWPTHTVVEVYSAWLARMIMAIFMDSQWNWFSSFNVHFWLWPDTWTSVKSVSTNALQMQLLFTIALLSPLGLVQGVQQCLYCTSGNPPHTINVDSNSSFARLWLISFFQIPMELFMTMIALWGKIIFLLQPPSSSPSSSSIELFPS